MLNLALLKAIYCTFLHTEPTPAVHAVVTKLCYSVNPLAFHRKRGTSVLKRRCCRSTLGKDAMKVLFCDVNTKKYIINTVLTTSYTLFENNGLNSSQIS